MPFCPNCGAPAEGSFCQACGRSLQPAGVSASSGLPDNAAGALCYLFGFITGIVFLLLEPYNRNRLIRFHAFQSIFLSLAWFVLWIGWTILATVLGVLPVIGAVMTGLFGIVLWLGFVVLWIVLLVKTYSGSKLVLPVIGPLAEKQAG
jgi:uncharacterized membrane protein